MSGGLVHRQACTGTPITRVSNIDTINNQSVTPHQKFHLKADTITQMFSLILSDYTSVKVEFRRIYGHRTPRTNKNDKGVMWPAVTLITNQQENEEYVNQFKSVHVHKMLR